MPEYRFRWDLPTEQASAESMRMWNEILPISIARELRRLGYDAKTNAKTAMYKDEMMSEEVEVIMEYPTDRKIITDRPLDDRAKAYIEEKVFSQFKDRLIIEEVQ